MNVMKALVLGSALIAALLPATPVDAAYGDRITISGTKFYAGGQEIWINGANTPWNAWNDFGGSFSYSWWDNHFQQLRNAGVNATRVWITCNGDVGINIDTNGFVSGATALHWQHLDSLFQIAQNRGVYIMATLISFDHTKVDNANYQRWRNLYNSNAAIDSYVSNYVVPFVNRYKSNPWLWSIDIVNEPDWVYEDPSRGGIAWDRIQTFFAKVAVGIKSNSNILVTVGIAVVKYHSTTVSGAVGNLVDDNALMAKVGGDTRAKLDFYSPHYYDWQKPYWGTPMYQTPSAFGITHDRPIVLGEVPALGSQGQTITNDFFNAYQNGWNGIMPWTSNGVDSYGSLTQMGPAASAFRDAHPNLVFPSGGGGGDTQAPSVPTNLASPAKSDTSVSLTWNASTDNVGVTGYDVYRGSTLAGSTASTSFTATGLSANTSYSFTVRAKDAAGNVSAASSALAVTTNPTSGGGGVKAEAESGVLTGCSTASALAGYSGSGYVDAATYNASPDNIRVTVNVATAGTYTLRIRYAATMGQKTQTLLVNNATIGDVVFASTSSWANRDVASVAFNAGANTIDLRAGWGYMHVDFFEVIGAGGGTSDTQAPSTPGNLTSPAKTDTTVSLSWSASTDNVGVTGYNVYNGASLAGSATGTSFTATGLAASTQYSFTVRAKDAAGNLSAASNAVSVTTNAPTSTDSAQLNFESNTQGFTGTSGVSLSSSTDRAFAGTRSLKLAINVGGSGAHYAKLANPSGLSAGKTITFRIWVPANVNIQGVQPYVMDNTWKWTGNWQLYANLTKGAWNTLTVTVPSNAATPLKELGVEVKSSGALNTSVYVDSIAW